MTKKDDDNTARVAKARDDGVIRLCEAAVFARAICYRRVAESKHGATGEAVAALVNVELWLALSVLDAMVADGELEKHGNLYRLPTLRKAA